MGHISTAPCSNLVRYLAPTAEAKSTHDIEHAMALSAAQVHSKTGGLLQRLERSEVSFCQVLHVDVVTHAGAIWGGVVSAIDVQVRALACGYLRDIRHEVVRCAAWVFANQTAGMCACRIKIA